MHPSKRYSCLAYGYKLLVFLLFTGCLCSCSQYRLKQDVSGERKVMLKNKDESIQVFYTEKEIRNPKEDRIYYWTRLREVHSSVGGYAGFLLHGDFIRFYLSGELKEKGKFKKGVKVGQWRFWDENGILISSENYKRGLKAGECRYVVENDTVKTFSFKKGVKHGKYNVMVDGVVFEEGKYKNGEMVAVEEPVKNEDDETENEQEESDETDE